MQQFQHFLITRMNIDWKLSKTRPPEVRNSLEFLDHRFEIFEKTCYPSVQAQTQKNFVWIILLDVGTPESFRTRIQSYSSKIKIIPIYVEHKDTMLQQLKSVIDEYILESTTHLITTNLDSDDVISKNFISTLQSQFKGQDFEFINFLFGYLYRMDEQRLYLREWLTAPCHTLVENYRQNQDYQTVLQYSHATIVLDKTRQVITEPMWLMTVHGQNVRTRLDVAAAWQPLSRLGNDFETMIDFPKRPLSTTVQDIFKETLKAISSQHSWDTPKVKVRKVMNILFPGLIRLNRVMRYSRQ